MNLSGGSHWFLATKDFPKEENNLEEKGKQLLL